MDAPIEQVPLTVVSFKLVLPLIAGYVLALFAFVRRSVKYFAACLVGSGILASLISMLEQLDKRYGSAKCFLILSKTSVLTLFGTLVTLFSDEKHVHMLSLLSNAVAGMALGGMKYVNNLEFAPSKRPVWLPFTVVFVGLLSIRFLARLVGHESPWFQYLMGVFIVAASGMIELVAKGVSLEAKYFVFSLASLAGFVLCVPFSLALKVQEKRMKSERPSLQGDESDTGKPAKYHYSYGMFLILSSNVVGAACVDSKVRVFVVYMVILALLASCMDAKERLPSIKKISLAFAMLGVSIFFEEGAMTFDYAHYLLQGFYALIVLCVFKLVVRGSTLVNFRPLVAGLLTFPIFIGFVFCLKEQEEDLKPQHEPFNGSTVFYLLSTLPLLATTIKNAIRRRKNRQAKKELQEIPGSDIIDGGFSIDSTVSSTNDSSKELPKSGEDSIPSSPVMIGGALDEKSISLETKRSSKWPKRIKKLRKNLISYKSAFMILLHVSVFIFGQECGRLNTWNAFVAFRFSALLSSVVLSIGTNWLNRYYCLLVCILSVEFFYSPYSAVFVTAAFSVTRFIGAIIHRFV
jgi:hypothetical protein